MFQPNDHPNTDPRLRVKKVSRVPRKSSGSNLHGYGVVLSEIGLVISLLILNGAFRAPLRVGQDFVLPEVESVVVEMEDIDQTRQIMKPPPPPRPPVPIQVPDDYAIEEEVLDIDAEINFDEPAEIPEPPAPRPTGAGEEGEIFIAVEEPPDLIGGMARLNQLVRYPEMARKAGIEGLVVVQFIIERDGSISNPTVMRSAGAILDEAAVAAVVQLRFKPGKQRGKAVRVKFALPIRFRLHDADAPLSSADARTELTEVYSNAI